MVSAPTTVSYLKRYFLAQEQTWKHAEDLLNRSQQSIHQLSSAEIRELGLLYRSVINDLSRAKSDPRFHHLIPYLNTLAQRIHGHVYENPPTTWHDILTYFTDTFPKTFWKHGRWIALAALVFFVGMAIAMVMVYLDPETTSYFMPEETLQQLQNQKLWTQGQNGAPHHSSMLMTNNIMVALRAYAFGLLFGVGTLISLFFNGMFALGGPLMVCFRYGMGDDLLYFAVAHGVIELSTIFIAGGAGMIVGFSLLYPGSIPRWEAVRRTSKDSLVLAMGCIPLLIIAGLIEGLFSLQDGMPNPLRVLVGLLSGLGMYGYLYYFGIHKTPKKASPEKHDESQSITGPKRFRAG